MVRIYGIKSCDNCRRARKWLTDHDVEHEYVDIRSDGLPAEIVAHLQAAAGWEALLNKRSITWRKIPAWDREELDAERARQLILTYPTVMRRPVLDLGDRVLLGFEEADYSEAFTGI